MHATLDNFLGLDKELSAFDSARVVILPVPYEATVSYGRGTKDGPQAIIEASKQVEQYDEELMFEPCKAGIATLKPLKVSGVRPQDLCDVIVPAVDGVIEKGKFPVIFGGEHSITPAIVRSIAKHYKDITVVQLDAHADLRQEYEGEAWSHACAMARVKETCPVVQVGIRNLSAAEAEWVGRGNLPVFFAHDICSSQGWMEGTIGRIAAKKVYLTIDIDVFDSSIMPATGTPEPGGLDWYQVTGFLRLLFNAKDVVGFDLVELSPIKGLHACDFLAAKLAHKCIGYRLLK